MVQLKPPARRLRIAFQTACCRNAPGPLLPERTQRWHWHFLGSCNGKCPDDPEPLVLMATLAGKPEHNVDPFVPWRFRPWTRPMRVAEVRPAYDPGMYTPSSRQQSRVKHPSVLVWSA